MTEMIFTKARYTIKYADIRHSIDEQGNLWFVAKDVCDYLEIAAPAGAYARIDEEDKVVCTINDPRGAQEMVVVSEAGLYQLIFESRKPEARAFKRWVFRELLPALRRYGYYRLDDQSKGMLPNGNSSYVPTRFGRQPFLDIIRDKNVTMMDAKKQLNSLDMPGVPLLNTTYHGQVYGRMYVSLALAKRAEKWLGRPAQELFTPDALVKIARKL